jgi:hypothetical protein
MQLVSLDSVPYYAFARNSLLLGLSATDQTGVAESGL